MENDACYPLGQGRRQAALVSLETVPHAIRSTKRMASCLGYAPKTPLITTQCICLQAAVNNPGTRHVDKKIGSDGNMILVHIRRVPDAVQSWCAERTLRSRLDLAVCVRPAGPRTELPQLMGLCRSSSQPCYASDGMHTTIIR
jgi:hypothetical protein